MVLQRRTEARARERERERQTNERTHAHARAHAQSLRNQFGNNVFKLIAVQTENMHKTDFCE